MDFENIYTRLQEKIFYLSKNWVRVSTPDKYSGRVICRSEYNSGYLKKLQPLLELIYNRKFTLYDCRDYANFIANQEVLPEEWKK